MRTPLIALLMLSSVLAGCFDGAAGEETFYPHYDPADGKYHFEFDTDAGLVHFDWAEGAIGKVWNKGDAPFDVRLPADFLLISGANGTSGSFSLAAESITVAPDEQRFFLAHPGAHNVTIEVGSESFDLDPTTAKDFKRSDQQIISGENTWNLSAFQEENFPDREPGFPNYYAAAEYFRDYFLELGYEVEFDPYGTHDLSEQGTTCQFVRAGNLCPESLLNIVATKPGTGPNADKTIFVAGGHYDMVRETTHAAFDDTSGTVATLELARAMAPYEFDHTLKFALWGGEENGILGSQFWVQTNPQATAQIVSYYNLDVVGMSWPAPLPAPDPVMIAAGPDVPGGTSGEGAGPVAESLLEWAQTLQQDVFGFPDEYFLYEGVASGQATGSAGVNAQSDHTPFIAKGIPAYFIFNADALVFGIHDEHDTLTNMTKYALWELDFAAENPNWDSEADFDAGRQALAESWEATMWFPFYHALLVDLGVYTPPAPANQS